MFTSRNSPALALLAGVIALSGCASPVVYRPEVEAFQKATTQTATFVGAKQAVLRDIRKELRTAELSERRPLLALSNACSESLSRYQELIRQGGKGALSAAEVSGCAIEFADDDLPHLRNLLNPEADLDNSSAFLDAVSAYAEALGAVATAGDRESFITAVNGLADSATSIATSASKAAGKQPPDLEALTPIGNLVAQAASYYLENERRKALEAGARAADPWIAQGAEGVAQVMYAAQFVVIQTRREQLLEQLDRVNEAEPAGYVAAADKAIAMGAELRQALASDPAAPFRALERAHRALLGAFSDRERLLAPSIAASKELFEAAREAKNALTRNQ